MRRSAGILGATIVAVGLTIGTAGVASALPVSIPGTTSHSYVAGVDVEPGSYYSRMTESTRWTCKVVMTPDGDNPPSHSTDFTYQIVEPVSYTTLTLPAQIVVFITVGAGGLKIG
ncbi:hypothetical protein, partial [Rhodococcus sp. NPDC058514]|uniref:hypothetical protein n=1 Tax=Rhodococcus sp. NPDC058514 TaxID=3346532 RepID=UPI0036545B0C